MNIWYFKLSGQGGPNEDVRFPFGFFVNCLIANKELLIDTKEAIIQDLKSEGFRNIHVDESGFFSDYTWDDESFREEMEILASAASDTPDVICYSNFHIWRLGSVPE